MTFPGVQGVGVGFIIVGVGASARYLVLVPRICCWRIKMLAPERMAREKRAIKRTTRRALLLGATKEVSLRGGECQEEN